MAKKYVAVTKDKSFNFPSKAKMNDFAKNVRMAGLKVATGTRDTKKDVSEVEFVNKLRKKL